MGGSFACPECGNSLMLKGLTPGRQVRCEWCRTWVEVPFLPRVAPKGRSSRAFHSKSKWAVWAWVGMGLVAFVVLVAGANRMFRTQSRQVHVEALNRLTDAAKADEREGLYGPALASIEAALIEAAKIEPKDDARLDRIRKWRDQLARREIESRLAVIANLAPGPAVGACLTLLARVREDPTLDIFEGPIGEQLERSRERLVEADLKAARQAFEAGNPSRVLECCERLAETANTLTSETRHRARAEADALVAQVVARRGAILGSIQGQYILGSDSSYASAVHALLADTLRQQGYLPRPASSFWGSLWDQRAPFHLTVEVIEQLPGLYMQSQNRISVIDLTLNLNQAGITKPIWECKVNARTRTPLPKLAAYQGSRLATSMHRDPAVERLFFQDARATLLERLTHLLRNLPAIRSPLSPHSTTANSHP